MTIDPNIILATWKMLILMPGMPLDICFGQVSDPAIDDGWPAIDNGTTAIPAGLSSGDPALKVASVDGGVGGDEPIVVESLSFGNVKALFR